MTGSDLRWNGWNGRKSLRDGAKLEPKIYTAGCSKNTKGLDILSKRTVKTLLIPAVSLSLILHPQLKSGNQCSHGLDWGDCRYLAHSTSAVVICVSPLFRPLERSAHVLYSLDLPQHLAAGFANCGCSVNMWCVKTKWTVLSERSP